jgi:hypothetical protein
MNQGQRATLKDIIPYQAQTHLTNNEIELIKATFRGNDELLTVLRKLFLPSVGDSSLPLEEIGKDAWLNIDFSMLQDSEIKPVVLARQDAIKFIGGGLLQLKIIANQKEESEQEAAARRAKDSTK